MCDLDCGFLPQLPFCGLSLGMENREKAAQLDRGNLGMKKSGKILKICY